MTKPADKSFENTSPSFTPSNTSSVIKDKEKERMKYLFPEKPSKNENKVSDNSDKLEGWRKRFEKIKESGLLDKIVWSVVGIFVIAGGGLFFYSKKLTIALNNEKVTIGRFIGEFVITEQNGPKPFIVSLRDAKTNEEFNNVEIAKNCRLFENKSYVGEKMQLIKFTMVNVNDENDKSYYFKGIEERICEGRAFTPDSSNAFYIK